jgi:hypothetical protein
MSKTDYTPSGWAMEARLNAEDPLRSFLPSAGTLGAVAFPLKDSGAPRCRDNPTLTPSSPAGWEPAAAACMSAAARPEGARGAASGPPRARGSARPALQQRRLQARGASGRARAPRQACAWTPGWRRARR